MVVILDLQRLLKHSVCADDELCDYDGHNGSKKNGEHVRTGDHRKDRVPDILPGGKRTAQRKDRNGAPHQKDELDPKILTDLFA